MAESKTERDLDYICTAIGAVLLIALAVVWGIATWNGMRLGWKVLAVPGGIGVVLMLPFNQLQRLVTALSGLIPGSGN